MAVIAPNGPYKILKTCYLPITPCLLPLAYSPSAAWDSSAPLGAFQASPREPIKKKERGGGSGGQRTPPDIIPGAY